MPYIKKPPIVRFNRHVNKRDETGCWIWTGSLLPAGYGRFSIDGFSMGLAHRFSYEYFVGPIPNGMQIDHLCRNKSCVNPAHLEAVTSSENNFRSVQYRSKRSTHTHCANGHLRSEKNSYIHNSGYINCRACRNESARKYRDKMKCLKTNDAL